MLWTPSSTNFSKPRSRKRWTLWKLLMDDPVHVYQKWLTMHIKSHVVARGAFTISVLLWALFLAKSYGY